MGQLTFITGPVRSGKSRRALELADAWGDGVVFVATWRRHCGDAEMEDRVRRHRAERPSVWRTLEAPGDVAAALESLLPPPAGVVLDCLTLWLSDRLELTDDAIVAAWDGQLARFRAAAWPTVIVGNEVGWSPVPEHPVTRRFRDLAGLLGQRTAAAADEAWLMVAGCPIQLRSGSAVGAASAAIGTPGDERMNRNPAAAGLLLQKTTRRILMNWNPPEIPPLAAHLEVALRARIDNKTKPPGSLGRLEELARRLGLMQGCIDPVLTSPTVVVFAGDHGLAAEGVSPFPAEVTPQMVLNFLAGGAAINVFARQNGLALKVVDAGVAAELPAHRDLLPLKVRAGTRNALHEPALTRAEVEACLTRGAAVIDDLARTGTNAVLFGEMGIGNTSAASLLVSALLPMDLADAVGRGAGHDDRGLAHKRDVLARVQARHAGTVNGPREALAAYGGCEIAMIAGAMLAAAARRMVIMVDGFIVTAALVVASRIQPTVLDYCVFAHASAESAHARVVAALGGRPLLDLGLRLGEGTGAALAWTLLAAAAGFLREMATFESAGVSERQEGVTA